MSFVQGKCPSCGGVLAVDNSKDAAVCPFCDTPFIVEKAINNYNITNNINVGTGAVINVMGGVESDFEIVAGFLNRYKGESADVIIPSNVTGIGKQAFSKCAGLKSVTIPDSVTSIGGLAFSNCTGLTSVTIPNSVTSIGGYAFSDCTGLTSVTIPDSVTSIGESAFYNCTGLTNVTIGNSVTSISDYAFDGCTGLTSVSIGNSVTSIGIYAFHGCTGLTSVTIPNSVTSIGCEAFSDCARLKSVTIGNSVTSIDDSAFSHCKGLTSITIPNNVTSIGVCAFHACSGLTSINVDKDNTVYHSTKDCLIETAKKKLILGCSNSLIPSDGSVTTIGYYAFCYCTGLTSVTIPDSITSIDNNAFFRCENIKSVVKPQHINDSVFQDSIWYKNRNNNYDNKNGCYIATAVYGSYDCPEVWTLRRYRDHSLALTRYGRLFIKTYYAVSPTVVKCFGHTAWFNRMWKGRLDHMVEKLKSKGFKDMPYNDKDR